MQADAISGRLESEKNEDLACELACYAYQKVAGNEEFTTYCD